MTTKYKVDVDYCPKDLTFETSLEIAKEMESAQKDAVDLQQKQPQALSMTTINTSNYLKSLCPHCEEVIGPLTALSGIRHSFDTKKGDI